MRLEPRGGHIWYRGVQIGHRVGRKEPDRQPVLDKASWNTCYCFSFVLMRVFSGYIEKNEFVYVK